ncbi:hypothetical protein Tco_1164201 [Tanacetum coccineum]
MRVAAEVCPGELLHNTTAQDTRERPLNVSLKNNLVDFLEIDITIHGSTITDTVPRSMITTVALRLMTLKRAHLCGEGDDDGGGGDAAETAEGGGEERRVAASGGGDRVDPVERRLFGALQPKNSHSMLGRKTFPGALVGDGLRWRALRRRSSARIIIERGGDHVDCI